MPKPMTQLLQNISWAMYHSIVYFAVAYLLWFILKKTLQKKLTAAIEYKILLLLLFTGIVQFLVNAVSLQTFETSVINSYTVFNHQDVLITGFGIFYLLFLCRNIWVLFPKKSFKKNVDLSPFNHPDLQNYLLTLCEHLKIKTPQIYLTAKQVVPYTKGFLKKIIVLPVSFMCQLTDQELEAVLLHEIAHIKRFDHFTNLLLVLSKILLHFNPFVLIFLKQIKLQRELACDDWVLQQNIRPNFYARALQKSAQIQLKENAFQLAMSVNKNELLFRIQRLFKEHKTNYFHFNWLPFLSILFILLLQQQKNYLPFSPLITGKFTVPVQATTNLQKNTILLVGGNSLKTAAKKNDLYNKTAVRPTLAKAPVIENIITVSNKEENIAYRTEIYTTRSKINDIVLQLEDSILLFQEQIGKDNIVDATKLPLSNLLAAIVNNNEQSNENMAFAAIPAKITVSQDGFENLFYNDVQLNQSIVYNATTGKWDILMELRNGTSLLGKRYIAVSLLRKLHTITL